MNGTGRHSENSGFLVILLLLVGLTAFSHSMKEWTEIFAPAEIPQTVVKVERVESCEAGKQSAPAVELPWLNETPGVPSALAPSRRHQAKVEKIERSVMTIPGEDEFAGLKRLRRINIDAIRMNPRDREMILKMLNRSINLRIAS